MHQLAIFEDEQEARIVQQQQEAAQREQRVAVFVKLQSVVPLLDVLGIFDNSEDASAALAADQAQVLQTMRPGENLSAFVCL